MKVDYQQVEELLNGLLSDKLIKVWKRMGAGHYRVNETLDLWPKRHKWHTLLSQKRGVYRDLTDFISGFFNPELRKK